LQVATGAVMSRLVLRFQSLALREDAGRSTIHFDLEDDDAIAHCHARVDEREGGVIEVGEVEGYGGAIDRAGFASVVERLFREQVESITRMWSRAELPSCVVALAEQIVIDGERGAAAW
jgi:hypothetical protein